MCGWWPRAVVLDMCIDLWEGRWVGRCEGGQVHREAERYAARLGMRANRRFCVRLDGQALVRAGRRPLWECMRTGKREVCACEQACMNMPVHTASVRACACVSRMRASHVHLGACAWVHARTCVANLLWSCRVRTRPPSPIGHSYRHAGAHFHSQVDCTWAPICIQHTYTHAYAYTQAGDCLCGSDVPCHSRAPSDDDTPSRAQVTMTRHSRAR